MKKVILAIVISLAIGAFIWKKFYSHFAPFGGFKTPVEAVKPELEKIEEKIYLVGNISSANSITVTTEVTGKIKNIAFKEGEKVEVGQLLIELDSDTYDSNVKYAKANLNLSQLETERKKSLYQKGVISKQAYDEAVADLKKNQESVNIALESLAKSKIYSPVNGVIGIRIVNKGDLVAQADKIVTIQNFDGVELNIQIPDIYLNKLQIGTKVIAKAEIYPDKQFEGQVIAIDPLLDEQSKLAKVKAKINNDGKKLYPGSFVKTEIILSEREGLILPDSAIFKTTQGDLAYKIIDGKVVFQPIKTGYRNKDKIEVVEGITKDDLIISAGHLKLGPGSEVQVINQEEKKETK